MIVSIFGSFIVLHGLVHMLYFGQSRRLFEMQPGMTWPDDSWALSGVLGQAGGRNTAAVLLVIAAAGLVAAGIGILARQGWARTALLAAAALSTLVYVLFWDGRLQHMDNNGFVGILINVALVVAAWVVRWPRID